MSNISLIWVGFSAGLEMGLEELRESRPTAAKQVLEGSPPGGGEQGRGGGGGGGSLLYPSCSSCGTSIM